VHISEIFEIRLALLFFLFVEEPSLVVSGCPPLFFVIPKTHPPVSNQLGQVKLDPQRKGRIIVFNHWQTAAIDPQKHY
jgi:hypothetical protein